MKNVGNVASALNDLVEKLNHQIVKTCLHLHNSSLIDISRNLKIIYILNEIKLNHMLHCCIIPQTLPCQGRNCFLMDKTFFTVHPWLLLHVAVWICHHYFLWYKYLHFIAVRWSFNGLCKGFY